MMKPIARIPMEIDSPPLHSIVHGELNSRNPRISAELIAAIHYAGQPNAEKQDEFLETLLDWAMQIRNEMGISWGECIHAASVLLYG